MLGAWGLKSCTWNLLHAFHPFSTFAPLMETVRQSKVARLLQKELAEMFRQKQSSFNNAMITVTIVRVSPDLSSAKIYLSVFAPKINKEEVLENVKDKSKTLRSELAKKLRYQLMKIPEMAFYIDDSLDYLENIDKLLKK